MVIFEIKNKRINSLKCGDAIYDIASGYKHKIISVDLVIRRGKKVTRLEVKEGYIYENAIKEWNEWKK